MAALSYSLTVSDRPPILHVAPPALDRIAVRRMFARVGDGEAEFARALTVARDALLERLDDIRIVPDRILDLGAGTGAAARELAVRFRRADVVCLDPVVTLLHRARSRPLSAPSTPWFVAGEAENQPLTSDSVDLVVSSLAMPWFDPIDAALAECMRTLRPGGLMLLSTLGTGTLKELSVAWSERSGTNRMHPFVDMHDLGDALVRAGFTDVVMDVERVRFPASDFWGLCRILSRSGGSNVLLTRRRGLTGVETFRAAADRFESNRDAGGVLAVSAEFVFGHAWAPVNADPSPPRALPRTDWSRNL